MPSHIQSEKIAQPAYVRLIATVILAVIFVLGFSATFALASEAQPSARIIYHFVDQQQLSDAVDFSEYDDHCFSVCSGKKEIEDGAVVIHANAHPSLMSVSTETHAFRVLQDYASSSAQGKGTKDITDQATYDPSNGTIVLPLDYADADLTVAWYIPDTARTTEIPLEISICKTIEGISSEAQLFHTFQAQDQVVNVKLFNDEERARKVENIRITQGGSELTTYVYQNGSLSLVATPLGGAITIELKDQSEPQRSEEDTECCINEAIRPFMSVMSSESSLSVASAESPSVGERFTLAANTATIRTCEPGGNMASIMGWPEKSSSYGFVVHFNSCVNPEVVNADQNHVASGGTLRTPGGGTYDYNWAKGLHFAWGDCSGNVDDNGTGEPRLQSGWVEVTNIDYNTGTVSYRYFLDVCSDIDGHDMQSIAGTFQVHEDLIGYLQLEKTSAIAEMSNNNSCYSIEGARYGIYSDAECKNLVETLSTDANGKAKSKALSPTTYYIKELTASKGFALDTTAHQVKVDAGTTKVVPLKEVPQSDPTPLLVAKYDTNRSYSSEYNSIQAGATSFAGAEFTVEYYPTLQQNYQGIGAQRTWVLKTDARGRIDLQNAAAHWVSGDSFFHDLNGEAALPLGTYVIQETKAAPGYNLNTNVIVRTVTGTSNGGASVSSYSTPLVPERIIRGGLELEKRDAESGLLSPLGAATLEGTTFTITNENSHEACVNGVFYQPGEICALLTIENGRAATSTDALPYGAYSIRETNAGMGYNTSDAEPRYFSITHEGQMISYSDTAESPTGHAFKNFVKRGDLKFIKVREDSGQRLAGIPFRITSQTTGESHIIVSDINGEVNTAASWIKHSQHTNENDQGAYSAENGIWFGKTIEGEITVPNDALGALPYDTYLLEELACEANKGLSLAKINFTIYRDSQTLDLDVVEDHVAENAWITTVATDAEDKDKYMAPAENVTINDHVKYGGLIPGETYTLTARLMMQESGELITAASGEATFIPQKEVGSVEVSIAADLEDLAGKEVVVSETLSRDGEVLLVHDEITNTEQTVSVFDTPVYAEPLNEPEVETITYEAEPEPEITIDEPLDQTGSSNASQVSTAATALGLGTLLVGAGLLKYCQVRRVRKAILNNMHTRAEL